MRKRLRNWMPPTPAYWHHSRPKIAALAFKVFGTLFIAWTALQILEHFFSI